MIAGSVIAKDSRGDGSEGQSQGRKRESVATMTARRGVGRGPTFVVTCSYVGPTSPPKPHTYYLAFAIVVATLS